MSLETKTIETKANTKRKDARPIKARPQNVYQGGSLPQVEDLTMGTYMKESCQTS
jgi:hypothetical protein